MVNNINRILKFDKRIYKLWDLQWVIEIINIFKLKFN